MKLGAKESGAIPSTFAYIFESRVYNLIKATILRQRVDT